jgi:hypothetical protein
MANESTSPAWMRPLTRWTLAPILALACLAAYLPAFNNGFVADDYATLVWGDKFIADPLILFTVPPQNFRMMSHAAFAGLERVFGYNAAGFYAFNLFVHFAVCLLVWRLMLRLTDPPTAGLASLFFSIFSAPQEAVMWLSAMNETLMAFFAVLTLLLWAKDRYAWASLTFVLALLSKESASVLPLLAVMVHWRQGKPLIGKKLLWLAIPTAAFVFTFLATKNANHMISGQNYAFGLQAVSVLLRTMNRLMWPWLYVVFLFAGLWGSGWPGSRKVLVALASIAAPMLPYAFIVYDRHLQSRHLYLACMVFALVMARLVQQLKWPTLRAAWIGVFCLFNILYIAIRKDRAFEERAAPTTALLDVLKSEKPSKLVIRDFPYREADIAKDVAVLVPGWSPDMIEFYRPEEKCSECVVVQWQPETRTYTKLATW